MGGRPALIRQADATRLLKAARDAGYDSARLVGHPDGRVEVVVERQGSQTRRRSAEINEWDEVLKP